MTSTLQNHIGREQVPQLFPPLRKSVLHNLAKKFVIGNPDLPFVAWCEPNNRRGDLGLRNKNRPRNFSEILDAVMKLQSQGERTVISSSRFRGESPRHFIL